MEDIYIFAIVFAVLMTYFGIMFICWRYNPIYLQAQLRMLKEGHVRRNLLSSQDKDGCIIYVVKYFLKKKRLLGKGERITHIISDTFIKVNGKYVIDKKDVKLSVNEFFQLTDQEPVNKDERISS